MTRLLAVVGLLAFAGWTLVLTELPWFRRTPLLERLAPYVPGSRGPAGRARSRLGAAATGRDVIEPLAQEVGARLARLFGVNESLAVRLERVHSSLSVTDFRMRQLAFLGAGLGGGTVVALLLRLSGGLALLFVLGGPLLGFLLVEQQLARASERWQRRLFLELPVVAEQLGMLVGAGYSVGAALTRLSQRGTGACAQDLARVCERIRLGLGEAAALREWAAVADVLALHRLVAVLALNRQAGDLDRLIGEEARAMRRDAHRELLASIERRAQQVWVPVTVATLVPGVIFLAVPFVEAMRMFASS